MTFSADDAWFDLVPQAMIEFDERGQVLRCNASLQRLVGESPAKGQYLSRCSPTLQRLTAWDTPLALLGLTPGTELTHRINLPQPAGRGRTFVSRIHAFAPPAEGEPQHYLCLLADPEADGGPLAVQLQTPGFEHSAAAPLEADDRLPEPAREQPEQLLHELSTILESSPAGIAYLRGDTLVRCNRRFERMLGLSAGSLPGQHLSALLASDPRINRVVTQSADELQNTGQFESELEIVAPGQPTRWYALSLRRIGQRTPLEVIAVLSDISRIRTQQAQLEALVDARRQAEQNLTLQADRTRAILDSVFVGIVTLDSTGIIWMNRSARRMFGGDLSDFLGQPISTVATPDLDHPFRLTDYLDELDDGQTHTFECQVMGRDGRIFWVVGNAVVTLGESNQRQITYALLDIDRRRQAEALTAEAQATLQRIIEMAPMAITLFDAKTLQVLQANHAASAFLSVDGCQALGLLLEDVFEGDRAKLVQADMLAALNLGEPLQREYKFQRHAGMQVWAVSYLPLAHDGLSTDQLLMVATDITEQRAAEQARLEAAIAQREMLVKEVHHRIKNNLQGVAGLLQQIAARKPEVASAISEVVGQVQAIAQVYGLQVGAGGPLRLRNVIEAIAHSVQRTFGRPIALEVEGTNAGDWQLPEAESIPIALSLNEILTNAHKHGPGNAPLSCKLVSDEQHVSIEVRNHGELPPGFNVDRVPGGVSGLGLVRALLPRRSSKLSMEQVGATVLTRIDLVPPGISLAPPTPPVLGEPTGQQIALWPQ